MLESNMTLTEAKAITGHASGLGRPSKMPGYSTSLPAKACQVGQRLAKIAGSVCSRCYADDRGNYSYPNVKLGLSRRLAALEHPRWTEGMIRLISHYTNPEDPFFRVHDSGDIQSADHLLRWVTIAKALPWVKFWMPTKEGRMLRTAMGRVDSWPVNLVVRMSAPMLGQAPPRSFAGLLSSTVQSGTGFECKAYTRDNKCGPCRACWSDKVPNIDYHIQ